MPLIICDLSTAQVLSSPAISHPWLASPQPLTYWEEFDTWLRDSCRETTEGWSLWTSSRSYVQTLSQGFRQCGPVELLMSTRRSMEVFLLAYDF